MLKIRLNLRNVIVIAICLAVTTMFSGCEDEKTKPLVKAAITGVESNDCPEKTVTLAASAADANSFLWKKDGAVIEGQTAATLTVSESGAYTAAGVNETGTGIFSELKNVTILKCSPLQATVTGVESNECPETTVTLTASATDANSFLWKKDSVVIEGQIAATLTVSESGAYTAAGVNETDTGIFSEPKNVTILACTTPPISSFTYADNLDFYILTSTSTGEISDYQWQISGNQSVMLLTPAAKETALELPSEATTVNVSLTVRNNGGSSTSLQSIALPSLTFSRQYGLGRNTGNEISNNVNYAWYIDQVNTGQHSLVNCGPACVTMALKWSDLSFSKTTEDARNTYLPEGGWWYTNNIIDYLTDYHTAHYIEPLTQANHLRNELDNGNIVILCLDMYYVRYHTGNPEWHIDKFYSADSKDWGHFIVVKGYKMVDGTVWFEVYDPWSLSVKYNDGTLKGIDRYYRGEDIIQATNDWWKYMIVIKNPRIPSVRSQGIDPSTIVHQRGR